jgi:hypothetical protein
VIAIFSCDATVAAFSKNVNASSGTGNRVMMSIRNVFPAADG